MEEKKVIIYTQATCSPCRDAKSWLTEANIPFEDRDIRADQKYQDELMERGSKGTPTFVIGDKMIQGFQKEKITAAWEAYNA